MNFRNQGSVSGETHGGASGDQLEYLLANLCVPVTNKEFFVREPGC